MSHLTTILRVAAHHPGFRRALLRDLRASKEIHVAVKDLPDALQKALKSVRYGGKDVGVQQASTFRPSEASAGFEGNQGYLILVDLTSGRMETLQGGWGGGNAFSRTTVDDDDSVNPIPPNSAVITGESGGRGNFARIKVHPSNFAAMMVEGPKDALTDKEQIALNSIVGLTSKGRADEFPRRGLGAYGPENPYVKRLAELGLVKLQGRSVQVTTEGKNRRTRSY